MARETPSKLLRGGCLIQGVLIGCDRPSCLPVPFLVPTAVAGSRGVQARFFRVLEFPLGVLDPASALPMRSKYGRGARERVRAFWI